MEAGTESQRGDKRRVNDLSGTLFQAAFPPKDTTGETQDSVPWMDLKFKESKKISH